MVALRGVFSGSGHRPSMSMYSRYRRGRFFCHSARVVAPSRKRWLRRSVSALRYFSIITSPGFGLSLGGWPATGTTAISRARTPPPNPLPCQERGSKPDSAFLLPLSVAGRGLGGGVDVRTLREDFMAASPAVKGFEAEYSEPNSVGSDTMKQRDSL